MFEPVDAALLPWEQWSVLLGRLHVLVVHFPIALLWMALAAEFLRVVRRREERSTTAFACLSVGAFSALVAAGLGWIHAEAEPLGRSLEETLFLHRWTGVATAGLALFTWILAVLRQGRAYRIALFATVVLVTSGANFGGELVYGEDYLRAPLAKLLDAPADSTDGAANRPFPADEAPRGGSTVQADPDAMPPADEPTTSARSVSFSSEVAPLLAERCHNCHGPRRQRADLRLDDLAAHFARDPAEWVVRPGDAEHSELYRRIRLPADDDDVMPASGDPLTEDEIALVRAWIDQGAHYE